MIWKLLARLAGCRVIEGPEAIRVQLPKWMARTWPGLRWDVAQRVMANYESDDYEILLIGERTILTQLINQPPQEGGDPRAWPTR